MYILFVLRKANFNDGNILTVGCTQNIAANETVFSGKATPVLSITSALGLALCLALTQKQRKMAK
jgi:hypothetical protein